MTNAAAGSADEQVLDEVQTVWTDRAAVHRHRIGDENDKGDGPLTDERLAEADRIVVAGGDGTIHTVLAEMHGRGLLRRDQPVGVIPMGTGNDLSRGRGIPLEPIEAAGLVLTGVPRAMDLVVDDQGLIVVNAAHIGVGARAAELADSAKDTLGSLGYLVGAALAGAGSRGWPMRVVLDDTTLSAGEDSLLMVGLAVGRTIGGGTPLAPDARPEDGLVDVVVVGATGPLERAAFATSMRSGMHVTRPDVQVLRGRCVRVQAQDAPLNVDGELVGSTGTRQWHVEHLVWSLVVPRPSASS